MKKVVMTILVLVFLFGFSGLALAKASAPHRQLAIETEIGTFPDNNAFGAYMTEIIKVIRRILEVAAVLMLVYAGILYMTSSGNPEPASQAKDIIIGVIVGLALLFLIEIILVQTIGLKFEIF